ncbi:hypothetical protein [Enterococcus wangshanyuanii]|uniref:Uncharacterized protein n=1 Tax=Enterococcus wangshanyuanii TaxID=2005703 RepID=A0ABQ1PD69_9ENTE|nr:hypothetical protein [Enterococcus wangshanyuanii]GGC94926.1 hypothetical protein GCM10011573_25720 [Enterococcus wangshanyuanii]
MNVKDLFKNKKVLSGVIAVVLVASVAGGKVYADNQKAQEQERIAKIKKEQLAKRDQLKNDAEKAVNDLFEKAIIDNEDDEKIAIKNDLKSDSVEKVKEKYFVVKSKDAWQININNMIENAENQLKQIDTAEKAVEQVYKEKVLNTDQKKYDTAKKEVDKIKNAKAKKELSDKLAKVKSDIDKKNKEKEDKKKETEKASKEAEVKEVSETVVKTNDVTEQQVVDATGQQIDQAQQQTPQAGQETGYYEPQTPATDNGAGTNQNVAPTAPANNGNTGGTQTPAPPAPEPTPEPTQPVGPPAGWITPPFPIGSAELGGWIFDNGFSGYDSSDGYIRPY